MRVKKSLQDKNYDKNLKLIGEYFSSMKFIQFQSNHKLPLSHITYRVDIDRVYLLNTLTQERVYLLMTCHPRIFKKYFFDPFMNLNWFAQTGSEIKWVKYIEEIDL